MSGFSFLFKKKNENVSYAAATVVAAMIAAAGLAVNEIIFVIASMLIAPVLADIEYTLGEKRHTVFPRTMVMIKRPKGKIKGFLYDLGVGSEVGEGIFRFLITIIMIILFSWIFGFVASSLNWIDLSAYFATNSQGELMREGSPSNQLASRINISKPVYFASIIATTLGGALLAITHYHAKKGITDQVIGVAIAASFAPPASALGLVLTLNNIWEPNVWQLGALTMNFLIANVAALYLGLFTAKVLFGTREKDKFKKEDYRRDVYPYIFFSLFSLALLITTTLVTLRIFY